MLVPSYHVWREKERGKRACPLRHCFAMPPVPRFVTYGDISPRTGENLSQSGRPWQRGKVLWISDKNRYYVLANVMHRVVEKPRKKAYNNSINRVRPCALSAASTGSCAADEGRPAVHGLHPAAAWTWVQARAACGSVPGSETCWIHALLCAVCHTGGRFIFNVLSGKIPFY